MAIGITVRRVRAPAMVWAIAVAVLVPIGIPLGYLLAQAFTVDA